MLTHRHISSCLVAAGLAFASLSFGEGDSPAAARPSVGEIPKLVSQMDADEFSVREAASERLTKIGKPAIGPLTQAAIAGSPEVSSRSIGILKKLLAGEDEPARQAARDALGKVADGDNGTAAVAARDALKAADAKQNAGRRVAIGSGGIRVAIAGNGLRRVSTYIINGVKTVEANEDGRKIKIVEGPNQPIKIEVTTTKDGKSATEKYEAKDAAELKTKHPKAHELYTKYAKGAGNLGGRLGVGRIAPRRPMGRLDLLSRMLNSWTMQMNRLATDKEVAAATLESKKQLQKKIAEAQEQLAELEKRLQKAIGEAGEKDAGETTPGAKAAQ